MRFAEHLLEYQTPMAGAPPAKASDVKVEPLEDSKYKVTVGPTAGPMVSLMRTLASRLRTKRGFKLTLKSGQEVPSWSRFKANGLIIRAPSRDALQAELDKAIKEHNKEIESQTKHKNSEPERKRESSQYQAGVAKQRKAALEDEYGKGTWNRVKIRQVGGDDGHQWTLFVDGRQHYNGMSKYEAESRQRSAADELAKREKLGKYAEDPLASARAYHKKA